MQLQVPKSEPKRSEGEIQESSSNKSNLDTSVKSNKIDPIEQEADNEEEDVADHESAQSSPDEVESNTNLAEQFRLAMKQTLMSNA